MDIKKENGKGIWIAVIVTLAVALIVVVVIAVIANSPAQKYSKQLKLAERYMEELDYDKAVAAYRAAIDIDPENPEAYEALAELYIDRGEDEEALEILKAGVGETEAEELKILLSETETRIAEAEKDSVEEAAAEAESAAEQGKEVKNADNEADHITEEESAEPVVSDGGYIVNDEGYAVFGHYEQDGDEANGPEPIEWEILEDRGDSVLLISRYILDRQPYNSELTDVTWESCSLRKWLNDDFMNAAFTPKEQGRIRTETLSNPDNAFWETEGGNDTADKLFCLSVEDIRKYYSFRSWNDEGYCQALMTGATVNAVNNGVYVNTITQEDYNTLYAGLGYDESCIGQLCGWWWTRSRCGTDTACYVWGYGYTGWINAINVNVDDEGVRPALYIEK
ncbi:MAG: tetratricopeptide repeat protein [Lachnospiraceae bacterium]|nr:tetratricopeptide repeat protein [Lachnospiraceae bacterium]